MRNLVLLASSAALLLTGSVGATPALAQTSSPTQAPAMDQLQPDARRSPVPYEDVRGIMLFQMLVADRSVWAVMDTSASGSVVDLKVVRDSGLTIETGAGEAQVTGGVISLSRAKAVPITVPGQIKLTASQFPAADLSGMYQGLGREVGFIFGHSFLRQMVLMVDPQRHLFQLLPTGAIKGGPPGSSEVALRPGSPVTTASVGDRSLSLAVSTALRYDLCLAPAAWASLSGSISNVTQAPLTDAAGKTTSVKQGRLKQLTFGGFTLDDIEVCELTSAAGADGVIGNGVMSRYSFAMDSAAGKLWLQPLSK